MDSGNGIEAQAGGMSLGEYNQVYLRIQMQVFRGENTFKLSDICIISVSNISRC